MAYSEVHLSQARHNERTATMLAQVRPYHDWGITAAFYAAIHYFEYWLYVHKSDTKERHTETSIPVDKHNKQIMSPHRWRVELIKKNVRKREVFTYFRELKVTSETARYLSDYRVGGNDAWVDQPASEFFSMESAKQIVRENLAALKKGFSIPDS